MVVVVVVVVLVVFVFFAVSSLRTCGGMRRRSSLWSLGRTKSWARSRNRMRARDVGDADGGCGCGCGCEAPHAGRDVLGVDVSVTVCEMGLRHCSLRE
jgi:hypothetical protein